MRSRRPGERVVLGGRGLGGGFLVGAPISSERRRVLPAHSRLSSLTDSRYAVCVLLVLNLLSISCCPAIRTPPGLSGCLHITDIGPAQNVLAIERWGLRTCDDRHVSGWPRRPLLAAMCRG